MLQLDVFLLILRLLFIVLLYLFLLQVVIAITRDLRKSLAESAAGPAGVKAPPALGHLVVLDSGPTNILPGTQFDLSPETTIGRGPTNTIRLMENTISGENTRLTFRKGVWYVVDAGSKNGTFVNNQPAVQALPAKPGDTIQVGLIRFMLKP